VIPGALLLPRNALEWRCDPTSQWRGPAITGHDLHLILVWQQGHQSSLAAATLQRLGHAQANDARVDGGGESGAADRADDRCVCTKDEANAPCRDVQSAVA
jgi:hypothetical protein